MSRLEAADVAHLHWTTKTAIAREKARQERISEQHGSKAAALWKHAAQLALRWSRSRTHYQEHLNVCSLESMHPVDPLDGEKMRRGQKLTEAQVQDKDDDLLTISPTVDGRLKDQGR
jgi:hypothetical protein